MSDILQFIVLFALHAATVCFLFAMLFLHRPRRWALRLLTIAVGMAALAMPYVFLSNTLGYPDPWPRSGVYDVLGWDIDESRQEIYLFVARKDDPTPRHYQVPFSLDAALTLQEAQETLTIFQKLSVRIEPGGTTETPAYRFLVRQKREAE
jgi:hypothetical protein